MILMNESWMAQERRERRKRVLHVLWAIMFLGWFAIGIAIGWLILP